MSRKRIHAVSKKNYFYSGFLLVELCFISSCRALFKNQLDVSGFFFFLLLLPISQIFLPRSHIQWQLLSDNVHHLFSFYNSATSTRRERSTLVQVVTAVPAWSRSTWCCSLTPTSVGTALWSQQKSQWWRQWRHSGKNTTGKKKSANYRDDCSRSKLMRVTLTSHARKKMSVMK